MEEKFLTTDQVANILQVHPYTVLKFIKEGKLRGVKLGRVYRVKESDMKKFLEERMIHSKEKTESKKKDESEESKSTVSYKIDKKKKEGGDEHYYII